MATLTRPKTTPRPVTSPLLTSAVPTPFPRHQLEQDSTPEGITTQEVSVDSETEVEVAGSSRTSEISLPSSVSNLHEILPSIAYVQRSCIMTLNNLLSAPTRWNPIVPDRRHSMPSTPQSSTAQQTHIESSSSALQTLVSNLRNQDVGEIMVEAHQSTTDSDLIQELRVRVQTSSLSLESRDALLADALVSLLSYFQRLSAIQNTPSALLRPHDIDSWNLNNAAAPADIFDTLKRQLSDLQVERLSSQPDILAPGVPPVLAVEAALLWSRIDEVLEAVVSMCKERTESLPRFSMDHLPPQYDPEGYHFDTPPEYESGARKSVEDKKSSQLHAHQSPISAGAQPNEKMRLDLEAVAMAIDRLYLVAPQLHNQRVELKSSKLAQMERARQEGVQSSSRLAAHGKQKEKEADVRELENILDLLGKASERTMKDQSYVVEGGMRTRVERTRLRELAQREAFVEQLARHSNAGRLHGQDAVLHPRTKDPETLLTLPEFIREALPAASVRVEDPRALLSLPEFVKEFPPPHIVQPEPQLPPIPMLKPKKKNRDRSLSAPALSWLRSSASRSVLNSSHTGTSHARSKSRGLSATPTGFEVHYVAENHENLQHVLVFFTVTGATPGVDIEAEALPSSEEHGLEGGDRLIITSGPHTTPPLSLPAHTTTGKKEVKVQSGHYEVKLFTVPPTTVVPSSEHASVPLLDASQLSSANPTSFICASCSLPLVHSSAIGDYRDLPSEHWEELVEAWMCHSDQKLHDQIQKHGKGGFWPHAGQALVGGSYILFDESAMAPNNLYHAAQPKRGEEWRLVRCLCGAVIGRCQQHQSGDRLKNNVYRLLKYAIRPVSLTSEPFKIPLSAFIVEDMTEFVQAHATYRFIVLDEEEERPRILMWLFKPSIKISYSASTSYAIPKTASIHAAKVLYKLLGPSEGSSDLKGLLNTYPGFPQAEYLFYPMDICHRLAGLLKESTSTYPPSMRTMTGLDVGWLHRA